jgi:hypothetical protein
MFEKSIYEIKYSFTLRIEIVIIKIIIRYRLAKTAKWNSFNAKEITWKIKL